MAERLDGSRTKDTSNLVSATSNTLPWSKPYQEVNKLASHPLASFFLGLPLFSHPYILISYYVKQAINISNSSLFIRVKKSFCKTGTLTLVIFVSTSLPECLLPPNVTGFKDKKYKQLHLNIQLKIKHIHSWLFPALS